MKESFLQTTKEVKKTENELSHYNNFLNRLKNCKEYIGTLPHDMKKAGLITVLFSMGIFSTAEAQNLDSNFSRVIDDFESGKNKIENAADSIHSSYKKLNDISTFSYVEYFSSKKDNKEDIDIKVSGPNI